MNKNPYKQIVDLLNPAQKQTQAFFIGIIKSISPLEITVNELPLYADNLMILSNVGTVATGSKVLLLAYNQQKYIIMGVIS